MTSLPTFRSIEVSDPAYEHDGLRLVTVKSPSLGRRGDLTLWIPPVEKIDILLVLLHGVYGSHWCWSLKGGVHRIAEALRVEGKIRPMVIAMPSDGLAKDGSAYLRHRDGEDAERWVVEEVPAIARLIAPALSADCKIAISGLSMGGYGALRLGAKYASHYSAISAHSAITDIEDLKDFVEEPIQSYVKLETSEELSALYWMRRMRSALPPLRFDCGDEDSLLSSNRHLHDSLTEDNIPHLYEELPGKHDWSYWQRQIAATLLFVEEQVSTGRRCSPRI